MEFCNWNQGWRHLILVATYLVTFGGAHADSVIPGTDPNPVPVQAPAPDRGDDNLIVPMDDIDILTACKTATDTYRKLMKDKKTDEKMLSKEDKDFLFNCPKMVTKFFNEYTCPSINGLCRDHAIGGLIIWGPGVELNINWAKKSELRGVVGIGFFATIEQGTGHYGVQMRLVTEVNANQMLGRPPAFMRRFRRTKKVEGTVEGKVENKIEENTSTVSRADLGINAPFADADVLQWIWGGVSLIVVPTRENSRLTMKDVIAAPVRPTSSSAIRNDFLGILRSTYVGVQVEVRKPTQSDAQQQQAFEGSLLYGTKGIGAMVSNNVDSSMSVMVSFTRSYGKIRTQSWSLEGLSLIDPSGIITHSDDRD